MAHFNGLLAALSESTAGRLAAFSRHSKKLWAARLESSGASHALTGCIWWQSVDEENAPWQAAPLQPNDAQGSIADSD